MKYVTAKLEKPRYIKLVLWSNLRFRICVTIVHPEWADVDFKNMNVNSAKHKVS